MAATLDNPYSDADYAAWNQRLQELNRIKLAIDRACAAKINVDGYDEQCSSLRAQLEALKASYFPQRP